MTPYQIFTMCFGSGILVTAWGYLFARLKKNQAENKALRLGIQALLRDRLYEKYEHYSELGYAPVRARENFENMWTQYHDLGKNGVMDDIHNKFLKLPTEKKGDPENE
jgi:hypothetical protein